MAPADAISDWPSGDARRSWGDPVAVLRGYKAVRGLICSPAGVKLQRVAANLHCRTGIESWLAPDTVVISHPKSGRTWLRIMLKDAGIERVCFSHAGACEQASLPIDALVAIVDSWRPKRILLLVRDPRDVAVSFFFQATRRTKVYSGCFADFLRDPRFGLERIICFNLAWVAKNLRFASFGLVSYEQLHTETLRTLGRVTQFLVGRQIGELELKKIIARNTFEALHQMELSGEGRKRWGFRLSPGDRNDVESYKTRRGIVGGWLDYFSSDDRLYATEILERHDYFARLRALDEELCPTVTGLSEAA